MSKLDLILLAAGKGTRTTLPVAKQFLNLAGTPVIIHALQPFERLAFVNRKIIAAPEDALAEVADLLERHAITNFHVIAGGSTRQESVRRALEHVGTERVLTHNAALPFVTEEMIKQVVAHDDPCVTTVTPMHYVLCRGADFATEMVNMTDLNIINTPQSFDTDLFRQCHQLALSDQISARTDCELLMKYGHAVRFVKGDACNFKITTELDVVTAEALMQRHNEDRC